MEIAQVLSRLQGVKGAYGQYTARCPAHGDRHNSLSVTAGRDGKILLHCHAGCGVADIAEALDLKIGDLFPENTPREIVKRYDYQDVDGNSICSKLRYSDKSFQWCRRDERGELVFNRTGIPPMLYNLPALKDCGSVMIVEGEKDVDTLKKHGVHALCAPDGAGPGKWKSAFNESLRGKIVCILGDNDAVGRAMVKETANSLLGIAKSVMVLDVCALWPELPEHGDISDVFAHLGAETAIQALKQLVMGAVEYVPEAEDGMETTASQPEEWEPPVPFETLQTPPFPTDSLPRPVADFVKAMAQSTQTPEEMGAVLSLGILATAFQSRYEVEITPDWREPLCLFPVAIAEPGERKSAVMNNLSSPVHDYEEARQKQEAPLIGQNRAEREMLEQELKIAKAEAARGPSRKRRNDDWVGAVDDIMDAHEKVEALTKEIAEFEEKHPYRLLVDDTTPEKLADIMDKQGGCVTVKSTEGGVFEIMAGRYDKNANLDIYLKGHAGDPIHIDRIGREANHIRHPRLTMMLAIQPEVLRGVMHNSAFRGRGLCGRFLYAMCSSKVGNRRINPPAIPTEVRENYRQLVTRILSGQDKGMIRLSEEAQEAMYAYAMQIEKRLGNEWEHMRDWGGKLVGAMLRIAALIHAAEAMGSPAETPVCAETLNAAIKIAEYFSSHAMAAYQVMGADKNREDAQYIVRRLKEAALAVIPQRHLYMLCRGKFGKMQELRPALQVLTDMGYIRMEEAYTGKRPSLQLAVNPMLISEGKMVI